MTSLILKSSASFTDATLPKLARDPRINAGSQYRYDFTNPYTLNGLGAGASPADGAVFKNLVDGQFDLTSLGLSGLTSVSSDGNGLVTPTASSNPATYLGLPAGANDMHDAGDHSFIVHLWESPDSAGQLGANVFGARAADTSPIWGATSGPFYMQNGSDGRTMTAFTRSNGTGNTVAMASGAMEGAANLASYAWTPTTEYLFKNGVLIATTTSPGVTVPSTRSHATVAFSAAPAAGDTVTINGNVVTFVTSGATGAQVNIGADGPTSATNLTAYINANKVALLARAEITLTTSTVTVLRTDANALTLVKSSANATLSAITAPVAAKLQTRAVKGKIYALAMDDLTLAGLTPAAAALAEYTSFRATLTAVGVA